MNTKLRIALLAMLGLSTAACCNTKKTSSGDSESVSVDTEAPRPIAMYAAPRPFPIPADVEEESQVNRPDGLVTPEGSAVVVLASEDSRRIMELLPEELATIASSSIVELEDGRVAMALPEALASRVVELMQQLNIEAVAARGVAFPDGSTVQVLTDERAAEILRGIEAEASAAE